MKNINHLISLYLMIASTILLGCVKTGNQTGAASLTIVNAINGNNVLFTNMTSLGPKGVPTTPLQYYITAATVPNGGSWEGSYTGQTTISLSPFPDTLQSLYTGTFDLKSGLIYSLYLFGDTTKVDTLFTIDQIPTYSLADSVAGIRFANLLSQGSPISINLQGNPPSQTEFNALSPSNVSAFKSYPANSSIPGFYNFEIRDQASDSLLLTFTWVYALNKNNTVVIMGSENTSGQYPISAFQVNNY